MGGSYESENTLLSPYMMESASSMESQDDSVIISDMAPKGFKFQKRACARCHRLKMKCIFDGKSSESCHRCLKSELMCSMTVDPTRKAVVPRPRKYGKPLETLQKLKNSLKASQREFSSLQKDNIIDSNITENNLDALQCQLDELQNMISCVKTMYHNNLPLTNSANSMRDGIVKPISLPALPYNKNIIKELIRRGVFTLEFAEGKASEFFEKLNPCWPCISFPQSHNFNWLLEKEPLLLLSLITAACLNDPDLHDVLLAHLEDQLALRVSGRQEISLVCIQIYLILSIWCSPPKKWGSYKHQMPLMMALNVSLCLDLGNIVNIDDFKVLKDESNERQVIRNFMGVYMSCGSLGLSVPRFKVVNWTPTHEKYCQLLIAGEANESDRFLYYSSRLIAIGEEIMSFFCPNGFPVITISNKGIDGVKNIMISYERRMQLLAVESGLFNQHSKLGNLLSIIYYQLLMTMYDYVVCSGLLYQEELNETYVQTLNRLIKASEKVIDSFTKLCSQTDSFPTFFYYRPMHSLVSLIRVRLLVKTQQLEIDVDVEKEYARVLAALNILSTSSKVAFKMAPVLTRVHKWMNASKEFNKTGATNSMVDLLNELGNEINTPNKVGNKDLEEGVNNDEEGDGEGSDLQPDYVLSPIGFTASEIMNPIEDIEVKANSEELNTLQAINGLFNKIDYEIMGNAGFENWPI